MKQTEHSDLTNEQLIDQVNASMPPCVDTLGSGKVVRFTNDKNGQPSVSVQFENTERHCHSGTIVQGGFVAGMIDNAMSLAVIVSTQYKFNPATLELKVNYLGQTTLGNNTAIGRIIKMGSSIAFLEGELRNAAGKKVATATATAKLIPFVGISPGT